MGPSVTRPVQDPLAAQHLGNRLYIDRVWYKLITLSNLTLYFFIGGSIPSMLDNSVIWAKNASKKWGGGKKMIAHNNWFSCQLNEAAAERWGHQGERIQAL